MNNAATTTYTLRANSNKGLAAIKWEAKRSPWGLDLYRNGHLQAEDVRPDAVREMVSWYGGRDSAAAARIAAALTK